MEQVVDYAYPCMMAERALKNVHSAVLKKDVEEAIQQAIVAETEARMTRNMLLLMKEKGNV